MFVTFASAQRQGSRTRHSRTNESVVRRDVAGASEAASTVALRLSRSNCDSCATSQVPARARSWLAGCVSLVRLAAELAGSCRGICMLCCATGVESNQGGTMGGDSMVRLGSTLLWGLVVVVCGLPAVALAEDCGCDHEVQPDQLTINGTDLGVQPGDVVCIMAGEREFLRIESLQGAENNRVVVKNCGGVVRIHNEERAYALVVEDGSHHFRITGTGDPDITYGFVI